MKTNTKIFIIIFIIFFIANIYTILCIFATNDTLNEKGRNICPLGSVQGIPLAMVKYIIYY